MYWFYTCRIMICTVAFGLGINIPDVRYIFHWGSSTTLLSYWQEVGRAARDGQPGAATLFPCNTRPKPDASMIDFLDKVEGGACMRITVLEGLSFKGMDLAHLEELQRRPVCSNQCTECTCPRCQCCCICKGQCPCRL